MPLITINDYLGALAMRNHFSHMYETAPQHFQGYALELFQQGKKRMLDKLESEIKEYETAVGYSTVAPRHFWLEQIRECCVLPTEPSLIWGSARVEAGSSDRIYRKDTIRINVSSCFPVPV